jgi:hypothetical protein
MRSRLTNSVVFWVTFATFGLAGAIWAVATPPEASPDEPFHTIRAAATVRGDVGGRTVEIPSPGPPLPNSIEYPVTVPESYAALTDAPTCFVFQPDVTADCQPALGTSTAEVRATVSTGSYPPLYYALVGWPSLVMNPDPGIYWMRVLSALVGAALFASGVVAAREADRSGFALVGVALALTPMALFMIGVVNPSGLEIAAAFATWTGALALLHAAPDHSISGATLVRFVLPALALAWSRPSGLVTLAVIGVIVWIFDGHRTTVVTLARDPRVVVAAGVTAVGLAGAALWIVVARSFDSFLGVPHPDLTPIDAAEQSFDKLPLRLEDLVGRFGWLDVSLPRVVPLVWGLAVVALVVVGLWCGRARQRGALVLACIAVLAMPIAAEAYRAPKYGFFWQGRYTLPIAVGVPILAALSIANRRKVAPRLVPSAIVACASIAACTHVVAHVVAMRRYITGADAPLLEYLAASTWDPPLPPWVLLGLCVIATVGWVAWLVVLAMTSAQATERAQPAATLGQLCSPASRSSSSTIGQPSTR